MTHQRITRATVTTVLALRRQLLRPSDPAGDDNCHYPGDEAPLTCHLALRDSVSDLILGIGSILQESEDRSDQGEKLPGSDMGSAWRLRGLAVRETARRFGRGSALVSALCAHAASCGLPAYVWCNGRVSAEAFYERNGFHVVGKSFALPTTGEHRRFRRALQSYDGEFSSQRCRT